MRFFTKAAEIFQRTQHRVGGFIVAGVVPVAGKTLADGIQVQNRCAQGCDIGELFRNTFKVTAEKIVIEYQAFFCRLPGNFFVPFFVDSIGLKLAG